MLYVRLEMQENKGIEFIVKIPQEEVEFYLFDMINAIKKRGIRTIIYSETPKYNLD